MSVSGRGDCESAGAMAEEALAAILRALQEGAPSAGGGRSGVHGVTKPGDFNGDPTMWPEWCFRMKAYLGMLAGGFELVELERAAV